MQNLLKNIWRKSQKIEKNILRNSEIQSFRLGIYAQPELLAWFVQEYPKHSKQKLDMGKSCVRFKKMEEIPFQLIGELMQKMSVDDWIKLYEEKVKR